MPQRPLDNDAQAGESAHEQEGVSTAATAPFALPPPEPPRAPPLDWPGAAARAAEHFGQRLPPSIPGYEILEELGHGGMGVVYRARHLSLGRVVALKMLRHGELAGPEHLARFQSEAESLARLQHPHIVQIYEVGQTGGLPFFAMEFVAGGTLAQRLKGIPQPPSAAAQLVEILARAIHAAHQCDIIHRDLKPANILLQIGESAAQTQAAPPERAPWSWQHAIPKISDFGLAKRLDLEIGQTRTGAVMGSPSYMAPEQAAGKSKDIGAAADVYGLGAILYELLTGRPPFLAESWEATRDLVLSQEPLPPRRLQPKLTRDLQTICLKCLEKDPDKRHASALELADELRRYLDGKPIRSRPVGITERLWRWSRRKPALAAFCGLAALAATVAVVAIIGFTLFKSRLSRDDQIRQATHALNEGIALCERGEGGQGLLWLARALALVPPDADDLEQAVRINLSGWRRQMHALRAVMPHEDDVLAVRFDPDGKTIWSAGKNGTVQSWDMRGERVGAGIFVRKKVLAVAFSPDCKTVAAASGQIVELWSVATGEPLGGPLRHRNLVQAVAFSSDGDHLLTAESLEKGGARLWDVANGKPLSVLREHETVRTFSPDGNIIATDRPSDLQFWNVSTGKPLELPLANRGEVRCVAFRPDRGLVLTGSQKTARLWEAATGQPVGHALPHGDKVLALAFSADGKHVLTGGADRSARLWEIAAAEEADRPLQHTDAVLSLALSLDGKALLSGGADGTAVLWESASGKRRHTLAHKDWIHAVAFSRDGKSVATGSGDKIAAVWDVASGQRVAEFPHDGRVWDVAFSPDGKALLTATGDHAKTADLWDIATGSRRGRLKHDAGVQSVAFSADGRTLLTASTDKTARLWNAATSQCLRTFRHGHWLQAAAFSPDEKAVLTASADHTAQLWDVASGERRSLFQHHGRVDAVAFSPDGKTILTGSADKTARLWDIASGTCLATLKHRGEVRRVAFSPDGKVLLTGSFDHTARLWQTASGYPLGPPLWHQGRVYAAVFAPGGDTIVTGGLDGMIRRWRIPEPLPGAADRIRLWSQAITGMQLGESGTVQAMDAQKWQQCRQTLALDGARTP